MNPLPVLRGNSGAAGQEFARLVCSAALGPVPADETARAAWESKTGAVAAHREATGFDDPDQAIGTMPGLAVTERRASHARAWDVLGQPQAALDETAMTEGQLRARARAARLELAWAPPHADAALRAAELAAEQARQDAAISRAAADHAAELGDAEAAAKHAAQAQAHDDQAALKQAVIGPLTEAAQARAAWAAATAVTRGQGTRAHAELTRRGITPGAEADRTSTQEWLAQDDAHDAAPARDRADQRDVPDERQRANERDLADGDEQADEHRLTDGHGLADDEIAARDAAARAAEDADRVITEADLTNPDTAHETPARPAAAATAARPAAAADTSGPEKGWGQGRSRPAHRELPEDVTSAEIEAAATTAALALAKARDRASQDAAHVEPADLDDSADLGSESYDAGRRRREAADQHTAAHDQAADYGHEGSGLDA